jgi:membrane-bound metal-dependent hydrolase YbcI (DUF457 family)
LQVFISVTILGSLLPDIDHTKSWIGKSVYPIAKWISRNYGHRTITHSIFFLIGIFLISIFIEKNFEKIIVFQLSYFFSVLSHFILIWLLYSIILSFLKILVYFLQTWEFVPGIFVKKELFFYVLLSNFAGLFANGFGPQSIIISTM